MARKLLVWLNVALVVLCTGYGVWHFQQVAAQTAQQHVQQIATQAQQQIAAAASSASNAQKNVQGTPVRLVIPRLVIDVTIKPGRYLAAQKTYAVDSNNADFIPGTAPITTAKGAAFIYGHDTNNVLGKTRDIQPGDIAYIYTDNGHVFSYTFQSAEVVKPTDTTVLSDVTVGSPRVKLMTCTGTWDQSRRIMTFTLKEAA